MLKPEPALKLDSAHSVGIILFKRRSIDVSDTRITRNDIKNLSSEFTGEIILSSCQAVNLHCTGAVQVYGSVSLLEIEPTRGAGPLNPELRLKGIGSQTQLWYTEHSEEPLA